MNRATRAWSSRQTPSILEPVREEPGSQRVRRAIAFSDPEPAKAGPGSLSNDPIPVRGAPKRGRDVSVASIATNPTQAEAEEDDDFDADMSDDQLGSAPSTRPASNGQAPEDQTQRYQIMNALSSDLSSSADELHFRLKNIKDKYDSPVFVSILKTKRNKFRASLEAHEDPDSNSPFIDFSWLRDLSARTGTKAAPLMNALVKANLVIALDEIEQIEMRDKQDILSFLEALDAAFPRLLLSDQPQSSARFANLALNIRTHHAIELLAAQRGRLDIDATIASVFRGSTRNTDNGQVSTHGPFKSLIGGDEDREEDPEIAERISTRVEHLLKEAKGLKRGSGVDQLRRLYPLAKIWTDVQKWCHERFAALPVIGHNDESGAREQEDAAREDFQDARETQDSIVESQGPSSSPAILRPPEGTEKQRSFIHRGGARAIQELENLGALPPPDAPSDYDIPASTLLQGNVSLRRTRTISDDEDEDGGGSVDDDDGDDDDFETDTRHVEPNARRAELRGPSPKRRRLPNPSPAPNTSFRSRGAAEPSHSPSPTLVPSQANFRDIQYKKQDVVARHRARHALSSSLPASSSSAARVSLSIAPRPRQRHTWSHDDSRLLIHYIKIHGAKWSLIQDQHNEHFEHPRDQQAYRDKARNIKVDCLMTDLNLPPNFDQVLLGKKEENKLLEMGKNPHRSEADVDRQGHPINTDC